MPKTSLSVLLAVGGCAAAPAADLVDQLPGFEKAPFNVYSAEDAAAANVPPKARTSASVCVLALGGGAVRTPMLCSIELSAMADCAACGRADGSLLLCRFSRDELMRSRFRAPYPTQPPVRSCRLLGHSGPIYGCSFAKDRQYVLSGSQARLCVVGACECMCLHVCRVTVHFPSLP